MKQLLFACALIVGTLTATAEADEIQLTNGDRVTGEILTSDGETLTVATELMGEVQIERSGIVDISSDGR